MDAASTTLEMQLGRDGGVLMQRMVRRRSMCEECPFRDKDEATKIGMALVDGFSCHMEDSPAEMGSGGIQCRGHWEAKRKRNRETPNDRTVAQPPTATPRKETDV